MLIEAITDFANAQYFSLDAQREHGVHLDPRDLSAVAARAWDDLRQERIYNLKSVLSPNMEELWSRPELRQFRQHFDVERLGWKLSALSSVGPDYAGVKIVGANALNRHLGRPRSMSTILLLDKITLSPVCILDGTEISAARTATYVSTVIETFLPNASNLSIFLFGAGPVAKRIVMALDLFAHAISNVYVRSRSIESASRFVSELAGLTTLSLKAVEDNASLPACGLVITASNAKQPIFRDEETRADVVTLHLGGDETPERHILRVLRTGSLICDDIGMVSRRNSQSLALYFARKGASLEQLGSVLGIENLKDARTEEVLKGGPIHITCVGLPMLDLYVAAYVFETFLRGKAGARDQSPFHQPELTAIGV